MTDLIRRFLNHTVFTHAAAVEKSGRCEDCDGVELVCYSDHNEDIRTKGSCDYCKGVDPID